jgi:hypothetical protein
MIILQDIRGCIILAGVFCLYRSQLMWGRRRALRRNAIQVNGVIVKHVPIERDDDSDDYSAPGMYEPIVRYKGSDGRSHEIVLDGTRDDKQFGIGKRVTIYYEKGNPANATECLTRMWDVYLSVIASIGILLLGLMLFYRTYEPSPSGVPTESRSLTTQ